MDSSLAAETLATTEYVSSLPDQDNQAIRDFMKYYRMAPYKELAEGVQKICIERLPEGVRAMVTCRAKKLDSLETKLRKMNDSLIKKGQPPFKTADEIYERIFDLAGVRIALYVPSQKEIVIQQLNSWFKEVKWIRKRGRNKDTCKTCLEKLEDRECESCRRMNKKQVSVAASPIIVDAEDTYDPVFAGYVADHARVRLFEEQGKKITDWRESCVVEIQVVSVLLHAWAEVEHDITYKSIMAEAGQAEKIILDSLNGIIRSSELLLDQLHESHTRRIQSFEKPFPHKFALATFLYDYIDGLLTEDEENNLELKMLFKLLQIVGLDTHQKLYPLLGDLGFKKRYTESDQKIMEERLQCLIENYQPFDFSNRMRIPFLIMERIISDLKDDHERALQEKACRNKVHDAWACQVIFSSFMWIGQLHDAESIWTATTEITPDFFDDDTLQWPFVAPLRWSILEGDGSTNKRDQVFMRTWWNWFSSQKDNSIISFAFRISKLGVIGSFPADLALFKKGQDRVSDLASDSDQSSSSVPVVSH